jgi:methylmalonyl-CoA/ethylmalonyl-CoA epimerase
MKKVEHIGIAVNNLEESSALYETLLGVPCYKTELVSSEAVETAFFQVGESKIELLSATNEQSVITRFIDKKGEGIHHIAFAVDDIFKEMERLKAAGFTLLSEQPKPGADNKLVCFVHPKGTNGVLIELCQDMNRL